MKFNYFSFLLQLKNNEYQQKRDIYKRKCDLSNATAIEDEPFYSYLKKHEFIKFKIPENLKNDFDWHLLFQLIASSNTSYYEFGFTDYKDSENNNDEKIITPELYLWTEGYLKKKVTELKDYQFPEMFRFYCEEQIDFEYRNFTNPLETNEIRNENLKYYYTQKFKVEGVLKRWEILR